MKRRGLIRLFDECECGGAERASKSRSAARRTLAPPRYLRPAGRLEARHFDHSEPVTLSVTAFGAAAYRTFATRDDYHLSAEPVGMYARSSSRSQPFYVEPFEETSDPEEGTRYTEVEVGGKPGQTPSDKEADAAGRTPSEQEEAEAADEFAEDVRRILAEKKKYENAHGTPPNKTVEPPAPVPAPPKEEPPKNEHAIFERIAQSMKLANAYDLGSVALNQRFDAFDREMDARADSARTSRPAPSEKTREFLEDMDAIRRPHDEPAREEEGPAEG